MTTKKSSFAGAKSTLKSGLGDLTYYHLGFLEKSSGVNLAKLPFSIRILLENVLRNIDDYLVRDDDVTNALKWTAKAPPAKDIPFMPGRVVLQDFTGVPAVVDLAALRSAMVRLGGDPKKINPLVPADLVIDHSVQVDYFGTQNSFVLNVDKEYERNQERYALLRWAQQAFNNFRVVPPGTGIVHQVNLEYLGAVVSTRKIGGANVAFPDTLVGTDSHTTMINGLGIVGWGVGGIEAEAVLLGQPYYMLMPEVIGFKLTGELREGVTATDLVLTVTEMLRKKGVVEKFVEFYGTGLSRLPVADRATIANMAPEYGATIGLFPVDDLTLRYMRNTGRDEKLVAMVDQYMKAQGLFRTDATPDPEFTDTLSLDMSTVEPSLAGPRRPQDRVPLGQMRKVFAKELPSLSGKPAPAGGGTAVAEKTGVAINLGGQQATIDHGAVVIAAITSCTNTSNPSVMVGAGLLAKKAMERGLHTKPWVKTSMAPGSQVVTDYLTQSGLVPYLDALGFHTVGYGCTTCIGNSGPLPEAVADAVTKGDLVASAVLSGNRNFEGRVHPQVKANYLASPMLVVAYALAGRVDMDLTTEPLGHDPNGQPVFLKDVWPTQKEIADAVTSALKPEMFKHRYGSVSEGDSRWKNMPVPKGELYAWDPKSTYVQEPPFFQGISTKVPDFKDIKNARVLVFVGDSVTTDHISPAGNIGAKSPAGQWLIQHGVHALDFNSFGARRGAHDVMIRGTFGNIRLKNLLTPDGAEGDWTAHLPDGTKMRIFEASEKYIAAGTPSIVIAGKEYGTGSSRDWAAKGPMLLGIKAAIAESFERIHRSNLVGMGVLPLQFKPGEGAKLLSLTGKETYTIEGITKGLTPGQDITVVARADDGKTTTFKTTLRIDTQVEVDYYRQGGVLHTVLRRLLSEKA